MRAIEVGGHRVEAGTMLVVGIYALHRDPTLWNDPLRPRMSRAPCGEVATTTDGISHLGPSLSRVTGPPASRNVSSPVWKALIAITCWRYGNGFTGARGSSFRVTFSIVSTMAFLQFS
jgi:hypothetical protein